MPHEPQRCHGERQEDEGEPGLRLLQLEPMRAPRCDDDVAVFCGSNSAGTDLHSIPAKFSKLAAPNGGASDMARRILALSVLFAQRFCSKGSVKNCVCTLLQRPGVLTRETASQQITRECTRTLSHAY